MHNIAESELLRHDVELRQLRFCLEPMDLFLLSQAAHSPII